MKNLLIIIHSLFWILMPHVLYGQEEEKLECVPDSVPTLYIADLDVDGYQDTITYDPINCELIFRLSSKKYFPEAYAYYLSNNPPFETSLIELYDGGFSFQFNHMRAESFKKYQYEKETGKFRLQYFYFSHHQFGSMSYQEEDRTFVGDWWYYTKEGEMVDLPQVILTMDNSLYWEDPENIVTTSTELFEEYCKVYEPEKTVILQFAEIGIDEYENFPDLYYFDSQTEKRRYGTVFCNYEEIKEKEKIRVTTGTFFYFEPGNGRYYPANGIIEIKRVDEENNLLMNKAKEDE